MAVTASAGTSGASYIWTSAPDAPTGHAWLGRAALTVRPGGWQTVDTDTLRYDWQLVDLVTGQHPGRRRDPGRVRGRPR